MRAYRPLAETLVSLAFPPPSARCGNSKAPTDYDLVHSTKLLAFRVEPFSRNSLVEPTSSFSPSTRRQHGRANATIGSGFSADRATIFHRPGFVLPSAPLLPAALTVIARSTPSINAPPTMRGLLHSVAEYENNQTTNERILGELVYLISMIIENGET